MDSTIAPQLSASSPGEGVCPGLVELVELATALANPFGRGGAARTLARRAGAEELMIFILDEEIGILLPAAGFAQTMPDSRRWRDFLANLARQSPAEGSLPFPDAASERSALGVQTHDGSALVLLGGRPSQQTAMALSVVLPMLASAFRSEQELIAATGKAAVASEAASHAKLLATSLDQARQALQRALLATEAASKAKDQFLAVLSHELRTPLAPVLTTASALLANATLPPELREAIEVIRRNTELEVRLIDDLLDLTRVTKGKMRLHLATVDMHSLIAQTLEICQSDIYRKKLRVSQELEASRHRVTGDAVRLQQVLWNLVKNSVKFTPAGGEIKIATSNEGPLIRLHVTDTGIGIEEEFIRKIFDAFEQTGDSVTHRFGGLGLGLAISKAVIDAHGGTLVAESAGRDRGSTFSASLTTAAPESSPGSTRRSEANPSCSKMLKLMLVEDHRDTAAVMSRLLKSLGHEVVIADSIGRALELAGQTPLDLVLSDLGLPDGSGLDLMRELRGRFGLAGVAISGYGMEDDLDRAKKAGFFAHLTKPVSFQQVQAILQQFSATNPSE